MGLLNIFKSKESSQDIPPPPPLEGLPNFPTPEELESKPQGKGKVQKTPKSSKKIMGDERIAQRESEKLSDLETTSPAKPIFIGLDEYREVVDELNQIKSSLDESLDVVKNLEEIKHTEDNRFEKWKKQVKDIHNKLIFVDHTLFEKK